MKELSAKTFFNLDKYRHSALFQNKTYVWEALNHLSDYLKKQHLGKIEVNIPDGVFLVNEHSISVGPGTIVEPGAYIEGPCVIGKNCHIRHGAYVRGDVLTGDGCVIGHATEIKHSILLDGACAAHFNYVGDSILGNQVNLGAGVVCANLRLDHAPIFVTVDGKKIGTELKKFGAIIGDESQIGCHCVTNPGTILEKKVFCYPCQNVRGYILENSKIKPAS